jgi:hypothetical protein
MIQDKEWSLLLKTNPTEGEIIRGKLEISGIKARLEQEAVGKIMGLTTDGLGEVKVYVPKEKLEEAKNILEEENQ